MGAYSTSQGCTVTYRLARTVFIYLTTCTDRHFVLNLLMFLYISPIWCCNVVIILCHISTSRHAACNPCLVISRVSITMYKFHTQLILCMGGGTGPPGLAIAPPKALRNGMVYIMIPNIIKLLSKFYQNRIYLHFQRSMTPDHAPKFQHSLFFPPNLMFWVHQGGSVLSALNWKYTVWILWMKSTIINEVWQKQCSKPQIRFIYQSHEWLLLITS